MNITTTKQENGVRIMEKNNTVEAEIVEDNQAVVLSEIKYPVSQTDLKKLLEDYKEIPDINPDADDETVGEQYQFVLKGHKAFVKARTGIEKTRKQLKQPALDYGKQVDGIAKEFQSMIIQTENKLQIQRKIVEDNEARKQREAEEAEEARIDGIKIKIKDFENYPLRFINSSSYQINMFLSDDLVAPTADIFEEFYDEAVEIFAKCSSQLIQMRDNKVLVEDAEKLQAEAKQKADAEEAERQAIREAEQKKLDEEKAEFQKQKDEFEAQQKAIQEEADRKEAERLADELQAKQEAEKKEANELAKKLNEEAEQKNKQLKAQHEHEAFEDLDNLLNRDGIDIVTLVDMIIDSKVRHIKWEA